jgi:chromosome partitioning protein
MRRISVLNFKGGVGKTSLTTNLAYSLSIKGYKTLIVDCDMQANASGLIPKDQRLPITLTHVLRGENDLNEAVQKARENLFLVASDRNLNQLRIDTLNRKLLENQ